MQSDLNEIANLAAHATTEPTRTDIPGVWIIQGDVPRHQLAAIYEPMIGFVVRGGKTISIGSEVIYLKAPAYFIIPTDMPAAGQVHQGADGYLSVALRLNQKVLSNLLGDLTDEFRPKKWRAKFSACAATPDFTDAWLRMLRLLKSPKDIPALAPVYEREILYRVLTGPEGWRLRQFCYEGDTFTGVHRSIRWIRENYLKSVDVKRIAARAGMGVTTFHRQFKQITGLSPIQFQKQLRLIEARRLLVFRASTVSNAAFEVGYESPSQFNREYSRFFGNPPGRDAAKLRKGAGGGAL